MDRDDYVLLIALGFLPLLALIGGGIFFAMRRLTSTTCPVCGVRIPLTGNLSTPPSCPQCSTPKAPRRVADDLCRACGLPIDAFYGLRLWDDCTYCRKCVEKRDAELVTIAAQSDRFQETMAAPPWKAFRNSFFILAAALNLVFGSIFLFGGGWEVFLAVQAVLLPLCGAFALAHALSYVNRRPITEVHEGKLRVWQGSSSFGEYALKECAWFRGNASFINPFLSDPGLVVLLPRRERQRQEYAFVGCGEKADRLWSALFEIAGVERRTDLEHSVGLRTYWISTAISIVALPFSFIFGLLVAVVGAFVIGTLTGDWDLASAISFPFFVPGCIYLFCFVIYSRTIPPALPPSLLEQRINYWRTMLALLVINGVCIFGALNLKGPPWHARIAGVATTLVLAVIVAHPLALRASRLALSKA